MLDIFQQLIGKVTRFGTIARQKVADDPGCRKARGRLTNYRIACAQRVPKSTTGDARKVEKSASELNYIPNLTAGTFSSNVSKLVAVIVPNLSNSIFADTFQALADVLRPEGYEMLIGHSDYDLEKEETLVRTYLLRQADVIVWTGHIHSADARKLLTAANVPIVGMWSLS